MNDGPVDSKELAERMIQVMHTFAHAVKNRLPPHEMRIPPNQLHILKMISHNPMTVSELARTHQVSPPTMSSMVDKLVKKGLMERERSEEDRRLVHVSITRDGEKLMSKAFSRLMGEVSKILEPLSNGEKEQIMNTFDILERAISADLST